jgi:hypothetical protein
MKITGRNQRWGFDLTVADTGNEKFMIGLCHDCCCCMPFCYAIANEREEMIRQLMMSSMYAVFGNVDALPHPIEWQMDHDSINLSAEFREFAKALGFKLVYEQAGERLLFSSTERELQELKIKVEGAMYTSKLTKKFLMKIPE